MTDKDKLRLIKRNVQSARILFHKEDDAFAYAGNSGILKALLEELEDLLKDML